MDSDVKIRVGADTKPLENAVKKSVKEIKKDIDGLGDAILTDQEIERQVKEREKILRKSIKDSKRRGIVPADETEEELFKYYNTQKVSSIGGKMWDRFYDTQGKQWLEPPGQLQEILKQRQEEQLRRIEKESEKRATEEILHVEEAITKEYGKQNDLAKKTGGEREQSSNKFFDTIKKGGNNLANLFGNMGKSIALLGKVAIFGTVLKVLMNLLERGFYAIAGFINNVLNKIKETNSDVYTKMQVIKAMIDSIAATITPILTNILQAALNAIIEAFRFVQHVVYAISGIDIFKFTADKLAENLKSSANSAKEMRKQLMGFDEANVISDTGTTSSIPKMNLDMKQNLLEGLTIDPNYFSTLFTKVKEGWGRFIGLVNELVTNPSQYANIFGPWTGMVQSMGRIFLDLIPVVKDVLDWIGGWVDIITGFIEGDWEKVGHGIEKVWLAVFNFIKDIIKLIYDVVSAPINTMLYAMTWLRDKIKTFFEYIHKKFDETIGSAVSWIMDRINDIKKFFNEHFNTTFEVDADTSKAETKITSLISKLFGGSGSVLTGGGALWSSSSGGLLKKIFGHDNGAIVLPQPGHGVPITDVMSERRAEGIIPLENPTAMEKLGEAIGKYVNIAIDNRMVVDGRVLASATNNQLNKERFLMNR